MWFSSLQKILLLVFSCEIVLQAQGLVIKRSPLELGYATFPNEVIKHKHVPIANKLIDDDDVDKDNAVTTVSATASKVQHTQEWVPGQVRHHSYIPGHIHHIVVPVLITKELQEVLVKPPENLYFYPRHYGGFGAGSYTGGQGAGHGYQIIFNQ